MFQWRAWWKERQGWAYKNELGPGDTGARDGDTTGCLVGVKLPLIGLEWLIGLFWPPGVAGRELLCALWAAKFGETLVLGVGVLGTAEGGIAGRVVLDDWKRLFCCWRVGRGLDGAAGSAGAPRPRLGLLGGAIVNAATGLKSSSSIKNVNIDENEVLFLQGCVMKDAQ